MIGEVSKAKAVSKEPSVGNANSSKLEPDENEVHKKEVTKNKAARDEAHEDKAYKE